MVLLIVDDEPSQRELLAGFLQRQGHQVFCAAGGDEALELYRRHPIDLVLLDHNMPGETGDLLIAKFKAINPQPKIVLMTAYAAVDLAVRCFKAGADDFLEKPLDLLELRDKLAAAEEQLLQLQDVLVVEEQLVDSPLPFPFVAKSSSMQQLLSLVRRVAKSPWPVLIEGETGSGKELVARLVHQLSERREGPFIEVNCAAIVESLFEAELFGHEKGAFTGAVGRRDGHFVAADGGTLFLDEIGELPLPLQAKLLRALQEQRIQPVGGSHSRAVDVRVVAATNAHLVAMVNENRFREDLYYRLNVFEVQVPPLRQRRDDIIALIELFLGDRTGQLELEPAALDALLKYDYPGNVRELRNLIQRAATLARGGWLRRTDLPPVVQARQREEGSRLSSLAPLPDQLEALEAELIRQRLEEAGGVQTRAAELLGISERVLRYKMAKYRLGRRRG
ncbi:sigma-54-dependent transcriptional regulator [Desulfuromonas thiophila]|uniref:Two-component system, NtrC family, response regulator AtoC n=1 Tax=Desulfuromonas thiophila TaxID=57664 RepID=A0A1G7E821_9BACT|nr:sigma-54 dependent transcriptional regulator [Desulfuromonas thiophila]SDE59769.1 two-component system, NtrC family, response regulator AtoC [Desulfuromonas thiophila]